MKRRASVVTVAIVFSSGSAYGFRTTEDYPELAAAGPVAWQAPPVFNGAGQSPRAYDGQFSTVVEAALSVWGAPECSAASASYAGQTLAAAAPDDGLNTIEWVYVDWARFGLPAQATAFTDLSYQEANGAWRIAEADIYLNAEAFQWVPGGLDGTQDAFTVLTHELGHALGLLHPCEPDGADGAPDCRAGHWSESVMYPFYAAGQTALSDDDVAGICYLYPAEPACPGGCPEGSVCTGRGCAVECGRTVCAPGAACLDGNCVGHVRCDQEACLSSPACREAPECVNSSTCPTGSCERGRALLGDPCSAPDECAGGTCGSDGYCRPACVSSADCSDGSSCDPNGACSARMAIGERCQTSSDCLGDRCLTRDPGEAVCTRSCDSSHRECPPGWACTEVAADLVCTPIHPAAGCQYGARAPLAPSSGASTALLSGLLFSLVLGRCSRGRRTSRRK